jgi:NADH-dependent peroxiredoxin subunit F
VFVQIGLLPNTEWLAGPPGVELNRRGEMVVDERGDTGISGIFAAGDCTTTADKQIATAMSTGSTAALSAFECLIRSAPQEAIA